MSETENRRATIRRLENLIKDLPRPDLEILNKMVVNRLKLMDKVETLLALSHFTVGERVSWYSRDGSEYVGIVIRLNDKTVSVQVDDGGFWNVSPQLLRKV